MPPFKLPSRSVPPVGPIGTVRSRLAISPRRSILTALLATLTLGVLASAPAAMASHSEAVYFEGSTDLLSPITRPHAIAQMQALGVKALRVELSWYDVAPGQKSATKPNFEATNPGAYSWGEYDALIGEAQKLHWKVLLTVTSPVPRWATSNKAAPYVTGPDDQDFEQFMTAVARHYGSSVLYSIWNEPNHPAFIRQELEGKVVLGGEGVVRRGVVPRDSEDLDAVLLQLGPPVSQAARFARAPGGVVLGIEVDEDVLAAMEVAQRDRLARASRKREIGSGRTGTQGRGSLHFIGHLAVLRRRRISE